MRVDLQRPFLPDIEEYKAVLQTIWDNDFLTNNGPLLREFEEKLKEYFRAPNVLAFVNGHTALDCAVKALDLKGEVVTTPFTFVSTVQAIIGNGLKPRFCDISPEDFNMDADLLPELINKNTAAIMPVHVFGKPCDTEKIGAVAKKHGIPVIYDAAHAFGSIASGRHLPLCGDVSMLSFHATKVFHSVEGGALIFQDEKLKEKFAQARNFGIDSFTQDVVGLGENGKMSEFHAAMGLLLLKEVETEISLRRTIDARYREGLAGIPGLSTAEIPKTLDRYNYSYFPVLVDDAYGLDAAGLQQKLQEAGVITRRYFYPCCNDLSFVKNRFAPQDKTPVARAVAQRILTLPIHGRMSEEQTDYVCGCIKSISRPY